MFFVLTADSYTAHVPWLIRELMEILKYHKKAFYSKQNIGSLFSDALMEKQERVETNLEAEKCI